MYLMVWTCYEYHYACSTENNAFEIITILGKSFMCTGNDLLLILIWILSQAASSLGNIIFWWGLDVFLI